ncbi:MAG TPA: SRPBCC family protein [Candidatus Eisenbacteria bacterium]|nr:SRPBCC family protein [Candidatus Eisenbacteria bacterium]
MTPSEEAAITPVVRSVTVKAPVDHAFRRFTAEMATWWPLRSHSIGQADAETVIMEGRVGGRILERIRGGSESIWGTVTAWEPPRRVAFTWHPGQDPATAQDVEVRFVAEGNETHVQLTHRGFERLGALGRKASRGYSLGWKHVLGFYAEHRGPFMVFMGALTAVMMAVQRRPRKAA